MIRIERRPLVRRDLREMCKGAGIISYLAGFHTTLGSGRS